MVSTEIKAKEIKYAKEHDFYHEMNFKKGIITSHICWLKRQNYLKGVRK